MRRIIVERVQPATDVSAWKAYAEFDRLAAPLLYAFIDPIDVARAFVERINLSPKLAQCRCRRCHGVGLVLPAEISFEVSP